MDLFFFLAHSLDSVSQILYLCVFGLELCNLVQTLIKHWHKMLFNISLIALRAIQSIVLEIFLSLFSSLLSLGVHTRGLASFNRPHLLASKVSNI